MDITPIQRQINASDIPPERLADNPKLTEAQKVGEVSRQFEAILLRQILENSQKTVIHSKFSDDSASAGIYRDLVTQHLADSISKSGTLGLAKTFEHQLTKQVSQGRAAKTSPAPEHETRSASPSSLSTWPSPRVTKTPSPFQPAATPAQTHE